MRRLFLVLLLLIAHLPAAGGDFRTGQTVPMKDTKPTNRAKVAVKLLSSGQRTQLLDLLNHGEIPKLCTLPGIGETRARNIQKTRPFLDPLDLLKVPGIGEQSLIDIIMHAKAGFPAPAEAGEAPSPGKSATRNRDWNVSSVKGAYRDPLVGWEGRARMRDESSVKLFARLPDS